MRIRGGLPDCYEVFVVEVDPGSRASLAGLRPGLRLVRILSPQLQTLTRIHSIVIIITLSSTHPPKSQLMCTHLLNHSLARSLAHPFLR
jgi:hypothetical protein